MAILAPYSLAGLWAMSDEAGEYVCDMALPGGGVTALERARLIPDPYRGRNEHDLRWIGALDRVASRVVTLEVTAFELVVSGLDTVATIRWNGVVALEAETQFRSYRADLSQVARAGENEVEIAVLSPVRAAAKRQAAQPFYIPHTQNDAVPHGNMLRKVQTDFGRDRNIALTPFGLDGDFRLEAAGAPRIDAVQVHQDHAPGRVRLTVAPTAENAESAEPRARLGAVEAIGTIANGRATLVLDIANPELWWPNGHGPQALHNLEIAVGTARTTTRIGLRSIELVTEPDDAGASLKLRVNGRDVFAKGANRIMADALSGRVEVAKTRALLHSAADVHMNMIRVGGGGRYEPDSFYDACDEPGLMFWQDFMFACDVPLDL